MDNKHAFFSIVVPTYRRRALLINCLKALSCLEYPNNRMEIIIVDDGGDTLPFDIIAAFRRQFDIKIIQQEHSGPSSARNAGAIQAKGEFLCFTDADCIPSPYWLKLLEIHFKETPDSAIGGKTLNGIPCNTYSNISQTIIDAVYEYYNSDPKKARFLTFTNLAIPRELFINIGGLNTNFTVSEDREFCDRWLRQGYRMIYDEKIVVYHVHHVTFRMFLQRHFNYGRGAFLYHQIRAIRNQKRIALESKSFYIKLLLYPFSKHSGYRTIFIATLIILSQMASTAGFFWEGAANRNLKGDRQNLFVSKA